jgi:opacity protein-like surface antigen
VRQAVCAALALALAGGASQAAFAQASLSLAENRSNLTVYGGGLSVDRGFADRYYGGLFYNQYFGDLGVHADMVDVSREENSAFAAVGMSWQAGPDVRSKIMIGSSTENADVHPDIYVSAQAQVRPTADQRTIVTPSVTYEHFRDGGAVTTPGVDGVYYFSFPSDANGYYVLQAGANVGFNNHTNQNSYTVGAGLQTVRSNGVSFGAYVDGGRMVYNPLLGIGLSTTYYTIQPALGLRLDPTREIFFRGEYTHTGFYNLAGGIVGYKLTF